jgi:hypothetical protein
MLWILILGSMSDPKWNGKLYKPIKFDEGMQPGTVEWERERRRRKGQVEHWREVRRQTEPPPSSDGLVVRLLRALFHIR